MRFTIALITLAASASAIDIALHKNNNCDGTSHGCTNVNPNTCCGVGTNTYRSVSTKAIPTNWKIQCRGYTNGHCSKLQDIRGSNGGNWICNRSENRFYYTGVGYNFVSRKRDDDETAIADSDCARPDKLFLADGTVYDLANLDDETYYEFLPISLEAETSEDIPKEFRDLRITE